MRNKDIDIPAIYHLVMSQNARIIANQNEILGKLDTLLENGGGQQAIELMEMQRKLNKANQDLRQKEIDDYFNRKK